MLLIEVQNNLTKNYTLKFNVKIPDEWDSATYLATFNKAIRKIIKIPSNVKLDEFAILYAGHYFKARLEGKTLVILDIYPTSNIPDRDKRKAGMKSVFKYSVIDISEKIEEVFSKEGPLSYHGLSISDSYHSNRRQGSKSDNNDEGRGLGNELEYQEVEESIKKAMDGVLKLRSIGIYTKYGFIVNKSIGLGCTFVFDDIVHGVKCHIVTYVPKKEDPFAFEYNVVFNV